MTLDLLFPTLPPALDGIGDHTVRLADALAPLCTVRIRTGAEPAHGPDGVATRSGYNFESREGLRRLMDDLRHDAPNWVVLQYNPFSYGRWGWNPYLPHALWQLRTAAPAIRLAVVVHEPFVPAHSWQFAVMATWQRLQFWTLGRLADVAFFSIAPWAMRFATWFPTTVVHHLPVGSNIPNVGAVPAVSRSAFDLPDDALVLGVFGSAHPSRLLPFVREAAHTIQRQQPVHVLYVGAAGDTVREHLGPDVPLTDTGPLPAVDVSRAFAAMDLYLAPFRKGVSTRRGSFLPGLQHGIPSLSTWGVHTDAMLLAQNDAAFALTPDDDPAAFATVAARLAADAKRRDRMGAAGRRFFDRHFRWSTLADRLLEGLLGTSGDGQADAALPSLPPFRSPLSGSRP